MRRLRRYGRKYFVEPHPTDPSKEIRYVCLEGREAGTYFRGTGKIVNGFASIEVPEDFRMVTAERGLTVVATPVGGLAMLAAIHQGLDKIVIQGSSDVEFNYMVNGVRKAFENHEPISENRDFIPSSADDTRLVASLPAESVRRLKANGTLNGDGSINSRLRIGSAGISGRAGNGRTSTRRIVDKVTTGSYSFFEMKAVGIKNLKARLSEYVRLAKAGETILVTERDEVVAEIRPSRRQRVTPEGLAETLDNLAEAGEITRAALPKIGWQWKPAAVALPAGTAKRILDEIRGERRIV